jgi:integrase
MGSGGTAKNRKTRRIEFNESLAALLEEMNAAPARKVSEYLFPSPRRKAGEDRPANTFRASLHLAREATGMPWIGFHHFRFFASRCVRSGIDFMTVAAWLGHSVGGILVGKVYGHLSDTHRKTSAGKIKFR